jgi:hypothetical protein
VAFRIALRRSLLKQGGLDSGGSSSSVPGAQLWQLRSAPSGTPPTSTTLWSESGARPPLGPHARARAGAHEDARVRGMISPPRATAGKKKGGSWGGADRTPVTRQRDNPQV